MAGGERLSATGVAVEVLATGYGALEGPAIGSDGRLYFSDLKAGGIHRWPGDDWRPLVPERTGIGGLCRHAAGGFVVSGPDVAHVDEGRMRTLLELDEVAPRPGTTAVGFNDLTADERGRVLVGVLRQDPSGRLVPGELLLITESHHHVVVHDDVHPNGLAFDRSGEHLFAADTFGRRLLRFDVRGGEIVGPPTALPIDVPGHPDGIATDLEGGVWVAFYRGGCVARFTGEGRLDRRIDVNASKPLSLCFAPDGRPVLYVVTGGDADLGETGCVLRVAVGVAGHEPAMAEL